MNCDERKIDISLLMDGENDTIFQKELFEHLAVCEKCREFMDSIIKIKESARKEIINFPEEIDDKVFSEILRRKEKYSNRFARSKPAFMKTRYSIPAPVIVFASISILFFLALFLFSFNKQNEQNQFTMKTPNSELVSSTQPVIIIYQMPEIEVPGYPLKQAKYNTNNPPNKIY